MNTDISDLQMDALAAVSSDELDIRKLSQMQLLQLGMEQLAYVKPGLDGRHDRVRDFRR